MKRIGCIALSVVAILIVGCTAPGNAMRAGFMAGASAEAGAKRASASKPIDTMDMRGLAMAAADSYAMAVEQACDQLRVDTARPDVADWAWQTKIATSLAAITNASGPHDAECLLDMVLFATLKRHAMEEHWIPTLLHDEGQPVLEAYRRAEADVWATAARALTPEQQDELRLLIDRWRSTHPGQYYFVQLRFASLSEDLDLDARSAHAKQPGSVFGLLRIDPLAGLNPVTVEMRNYRAMSERLIYMSVRIPRVIGWQVEYAALRATATPQVHRMLDTADRVAGLAERLPADVAKEREAALAQVQDLVKSEREAAIDQMDRLLAHQREGLNSDLTAQASQLRQVIGDVSALVGQTEKAVLEVNRSASRTVITTEEAGRRTMMMGFRLALVLILVIVFAPPTALLLYRLAVRRWIIPPSDTPEMRSLSR